MLTTLTLTDQERRAIGAALNFSIAVQDAMEGSTVELEELRARVLDGLEVHHGA